MLTDEGPRADLVAAVRELERRGLNHNSSGNVSVRVGDGRVLVTPSGITAMDMAPADCVLLEIDGAPARPGQRVPTTEWHLHLAIYESRPDVAAIVHTHSPAATAASTLRRPLPAVHYVVARFGPAEGDGELACAPYATYGTKQLAEAVRDTLGAGGQACLMANHGAVALADSLPAAVALAHDVEWFCEVYSRADALGIPVALTADELAEVAARFRTYGQPRTVA